MLPWSLLILLFVVSAAQNMTTSLLTLLFSKTLEPQQTTAFWLFMSWIYWFSPVSGWLSDVCGSRKVMLCFGLVCNIAAWYAITFGAFDYKMFIIVGLFQNLSMLFVNSAINGALVEVSRCVENQQQQQSDDEDDNDAQPVPGAVTVEQPLLINSASQLDDDAADDDDQSLRSRSSGSDSPIVELPDSSSMLNESGATQSKAMLARSLGSVLGAVIQTFALIYIDLRPALAIGSTVYGVAAITAVFAELTPPPAPSVAEAPQQPAEEEDQSQQGPDTSSLCSRVQSVFYRLRQLCDAQRGKGERSAAVDVMLLLAFIFCNNMLPDATTFYQQYVFEAFSFPNWFNSCFQLGNLLGALAGCEVYRRWLAPLSQTSVFMAGCLAAAFSYATGIAFATGFTRDELHVSNSVYLMVDTFVVGFLNRISFLPVLHVASSRCPRGFEAVVFELFSLAAMGGATVSSIVAIKVADALSISRANWSKLWILMVISAVSRLLPLFVVPHLPPPVSKEESEVLAAADAEEEEEEEETR